MAHLLRATVLSALVVALVAVAAVPVLAAAPTRTSEEVHIFGDFPAGTRCPFEVIRTIDGTLVTTVYTDADGLTRTTLSYRNGTIRYLNPANGKTMFSPLAGPETSIDNGDGTTTLRVQGNAQRYVAAGHGFIVGSTGLLIATLDTATGEVLSIDFEAGHQDGTAFPALCVGLE